MRIFLTYASEQKASAEAIAFSLRGRGHHVFLDKDDLPPGQNYEVQIENAISQSDYLLFLISPQSVSPGRFTLTELELARRKWRHPDGHILPIMVVPTEMRDVPEFLRAVTILEPKGNLAAETAAHVKETDQHKVRNLLLYFAAAGAISGVLSTYATDIVPSIRFPGGTNIWHGIFFGMALAIVFYWRLQTPLIRLAVLLVGVQAAWQIAMTTYNAATADVEKPYNRPITQLQPHTTAIRVAQAATGNVFSDAGPSWRFAQAADGTDAAAADAATDTPAEETVSSDEYRSQIASFLPLVIAGAIGAFVTWLAATVCRPKLLNPEAAVFTTFVGAALGPLLFIGLPVLFVCWQSGVATAIGYSIINRR